MQNGKGRTPLYAAALSGHVAAAKVLIKYAADVNISARFGRTPLWIAVENGHLKLAANLLKAGANPGIKDDNGQSRKLRNGEIAIMHNLSLFFLLFHNYATPYVPPLLLYPL